MGRGAWGGPRSVAEARVVEWAERYRDAMQRIALDLMNDTDDAKGVVQRALVAAVTKMRRKPQAVKRIRNPGAWLARITRNVAYDTLRKRARRQRIWRGNETEIRKRLFPEQDFGWDVDRLSEVVAVAAESVLSGGQLRVVRGMLEGKTDAEIARTERMARGSVRRLRSEAVRALRVVLGGGGGADRQPKLSGSGNGKALQEGQFDGGGRTIGPRGCGRLRERNRGLVTTIEYEGLAIDRQQTVLTPQSQGGRMKTRSSLATQNPTRSKCTSLAMLLATLVLIAAITPTNDQSAGRSEGAMITSALWPNAQELCGACDNIKQPDGSYVHWAVAWWNSSGPDEGEDGWHFNNEPDKCRDHHPWCGEEQTQLARAVADAVESEDVGRLARLVDTSSATIVASRRAIQIPGCDSSVVAGHVPLPQGLMKPLQLAIADMEDSQ